MQRLKLNSIPFALTLALAGASLQAVASDNNGTDPTKPTSTATTSFENISLTNGLSSRTVNFNVGTPVSSDGRTVVNVKLPVNSISGLPNETYGTGDLGINLTKVLTVTRDYGVVLIGGMVFDTASRAELGTGKNIFKATAIYAKFLEGGAIFAPALVHSASVGGDSNRTTVNATAIDFYYVPKLSNPKMFVTVDPALNFDWESNKQYAALAVTVGYQLGKMLGGNGQVFIKPSTTLGGNRPSEWGLEVGFKLLGW